MSVRGARILTVVYFLLYTLAVIWPGYVPFNRVEPQVLGLPFSMVWPTLWLVGGAGVLFLLDRVETRERDETTTGGER